MAKRANRIARSARLLFVRDASSPHPYLRDRPDRAISIAARPTPLRMITTIDTQTA
jgi:hypothetical protein